MQEVFLKIANSESNLLNPLNDPNMAVEKLQLSSYQFAGFSELTKTTWSWRTNKKWNFKLCTKQTNDALVS